MSKSICVCDLSVIVHHDLLLATGMAKSILLLISPMYVCMQSIFIIASSFACNTRQKAICHIKINNYDQSHTEALDFKSLLIVH